MMRRPLPYECPGPFDARQASSYGSPFRASLPLAATIAISAIIFLGGCEHYNQRSVFLRAPSEVQELTAPRPEVLPRPDTVASFQGPPASRYTHLAVSPDGMIALGVGATCGATILDPTMSVTMATIRDCGDPLRHPRTFSTLTWTAQGELGLFDGVSRRFVTFDRQGNPTSLLELFKPQPDEDFPIVIPISDTEVLATREHFGPSPPLQSGSYAEQLIQTRGIHDGPPTWGILEAPDAVRKYDTHRVFGLELCVRQSPSNDIVFVALNRWTHEVFLGRPHEQRLARAHAPMPGPHFRRRPETSGYVDPVPGRFFLACSDEFAVAIKGFRQDGEEPSSKSLVGWVDLISFEGRIVRRLRLAESTEMATAQAVALGSHGLLYVLVRTGERQAILRYDLLEGVG